MHPDTGSGSPGTVLVTGSSSGIGRKLAERLAAAGWTVFVHGRDQARARETADAVARHAPAGLVEPVAADLADLGQVEGLARELAERAPRLDALVNNAGVATPNHLIGVRRLSVDGYQLEWQVNFLAPVLLTLRLTDLLASGSAPGRVVNVSSSSQGFGTIHWDDTQLERHWDRMTAYAQSKVAITMFTAEYAQRVPARLVAANSVHPGTCYTKMIRSTLLFAPHSAGYGAANVQRVLVSPRYRGVTGEFVFERRPAAPNPLARDQVARRRLWDLAAAQLGITEPWWGGGADSQPTTRRAAAQQLTSNRSTAMDGGPGSE
jgi:NAD(P)-dependent dehydrogenase (short-subunit alcohol dehydrogenase family)